MRRHRYTARSYRSGNVKKTKKQTLFRILFVLVAALILFILSVLLGRYLKNASDSSKQLSSEWLDTESTQTEAAELYPDGVPIKDDVSPREICAADIDITSADADTLCEKIDSLASLYNAVSVRVSNADGTLVYASPALMEYVRLDPERADNSATAEVTQSAAVTDKPADEDKDGEDSDNGDTKADPDSVTVEYDIFENLKTVAEYTHSRSLYTVCIISADGAVSEDGVLSEACCERDSVLAGELAELGFDEILITGLFDGDSQLPHETLRAIISYLARLRASTGDARLGVNLSDSAYLIPQNASSIKTLSEYADFLSISIETAAEDADRAYSSVYDNCYSLKGNFSMYTLRALVNSEDEAIASAMYASLRELSAKSFQFTCYVASPEYSQSAKADDSSASTDGVIVNDNASRRDDYENGEDDT